MLSNLTKRALHVRWAFLILLIVGFSFSVDVIAAPPTTKPVRKTTPSTPMYRDNIIAPDFAPGQWTDGVERHMEDYKGKVIIIFAFDPTYIDSPGEVKKALAVYDLFRDKPVAFLGIVNGDRNVAANVPFLKNLGVNYPMYYDNLGQMQSRYYGYSVNLQMIDADGHSGMMRLTPQDVDHALKDVKWKYKDSGYDKKLDSVIDLLEWNHYEAASKQLKPLRKSSNKDLAASAEKLYGEVYAEGQKWKADSDAALEAEPVTAFDLYTKISTIFAGEDIARATVEPIKQLKTTKPIQEELAARVMFQKLYTVIPKARKEQKFDIAAYCDSIVKKYPGTPTGQKAKVLWGELLGQY